MKACLIGFFLFLFGGVLAGQLHAQSRAGAVRSRTPAGTDQGVGLGEPPERIDSAALLAKALAGPLATFRLSKELALEDPSDRALLFRRGEDLRLVIWTNGIGRRFVEVPSSPGELASFSVDGESLGSVPVDQSPAVVPISREPVIYAANRANQLLTIAAFAELVEAKRQVSGPQEVDLSVAFFNPFDEPIALIGPGGEPFGIEPGQRRRVTRRVFVGRWSEPKRFLVGASGINQAVEIRATNPIRLSLTPEHLEAVSLHVLNEGGDRFRARVELLLERPETEDEPFVFGIEVGRGEASKTVRLPMSRTNELPFPLRAVLRLYPLSMEGWSSEDLLLAESPSTRFVSAGEFTKVDERNRPILYEAEEPNGGFSILSVAEPRDEPFPVPQRAGCVLAYQFSQPGTSAAVLPVMPRQKAILAVPTSLGVWLYGDGSGNRVGVRIRESDETLELVDPVLVDWTGWRYRQFFFDDTYEMPIVFDALIAVEHVEGAKPQGSIFLNNPVLIYEF